jgi:hypothetical protein
MSYISVYRSFITALSLWILAGCASAPLPPVPKDDLKIQQLSAKYQLAVQFNLDNISVSPWDLRFSLHQHDSPQLQLYLRLFHEEFHKLPPALIQKVNLKHIVLLQHLTVAEQPRLAVPDYVHEVLYYDTSDTRGMPYMPHQRHVVHHEFYHMLEQQFYGSAYYRDPLWQQLNPIGFQYGNGGATVRDPKVAKFSHPAPGFINHYAMSGLEEDKAELWAVLWTTHGWAAVQPMVARDKILQRKVQLLVSQLVCQVPELVDPLLPRLQSVSLNLLPCDRFAAAAQSY